MAFTHRFLRWFAPAALAVSAVLCAAPHANAHNVNVDGDPTDWFTRTANGDNLGIIARDANQRGEYVWRDNTADTRTDISAPETIADLQRVQITSNAVGLSVLVVTTGTSVAATSPIQFQLAIDTDRVDGSGQTALAGFADTSVSNSARWEYLVQTQLTAGNFAIVRDTTFATVGANVPVSVATGTSNTGILEFTVPWRSLGLTSPPTTPLRFTVATFRERADGNTVDVGGPMVSNALDLITDYNAPDATAPYPNTFAELTTDTIVDYNFDVWFQSDGEAYAPLLVARYISNATADTTGGNEWIVVRNMTPSTLTLDTFRITDEETAANTGESAHSFPTGSSLASGATFIAAANGAHYFGRFGERPDGEWTAGDPMTPDMPGYTRWTTTTAGIALANAGDEILVLDRSHTAVDIVTYGTGTYAGVTNMSAPAANTVATRNATFVDRDDCVMDFSTTTALCVDDTTCTGACAACTLNTCSPRPSTFVCRAAAVGGCDVAETCDGTSTACPADGFAGTTTVCRPAIAGGCDVAETCTGTSAACPTDGFANNTTVCRPATGGACDVAESCTGTSALCPVDGVADNTTLCRAAVPGGCDVAEFCTGSSMACPTDGFAPGTTQCRAAAPGGCDVAESCTGTSATCPIDGFAPMTQICRAAVPGGCDVAETCTGSSSTCPLDSFAMVGTTCRAAASGGCDVAETCSGMSNACPSDSFAMMGTTCRAAGPGGCDVAEVCTGSTAACPGDGVASAGTTCRAAVSGGCDVAESCDGSSNACPSDSFAPSTTVCRASIGTCDTEETCTGSSNACPSDSFAPSTTVCRGSMGQCDLEERCTGSSNTCPSDSVASNTTVCRASAGTCDTEERCDGTSTQCPMNSFASINTPCADSDRCNGDETCDGNGTCRMGTPVSCPPTAQACRVNTCDPSSGMCVLNNAMSGTLCEDGNLCNGIETCNNAGVCLAGTPPDDAGLMCTDAGTDAGPDVVDVVDVIDVADVPSAPDVIDVADVSNNDVPALDASDVVDAGSVDVADVRADIVITDAPRPDVSTDSAVADTGPRDAGNDTGSENSTVTGGGCTCTTTPGRSVSHRGLVLGMIVSASAFLRMRRRRTR